MERDEPHNNGYESAGDAVMSTGVSILYHDIAPEAKDNCTVSASESYFGDRYEAQLKREGMQLYNYACPCEDYQCLLDGTATAFPSDPDVANVGLWSEQLSEADGTFQSPITLTLETEGQYSSQGFTFAFDKFNDIFATKLNIVWMRDSEVLSNIDFYPTSGFYYCKNKVDNFTKVIITVYSLNMPYNRLKIESIDYGHVKIFYGDELRSVNLSQAIDEISSEIKINPCDFTVDVKDGEEYSFQAKQPIQVEFNDKVLATVFTKSAKRNSRFLYSVNAEDYIGIMDSVAFVGDIYDNEPASNIFKAIFAASKVPYTIPDECDEMLLSGYIPYTTCREALKQVCFATQTVADTSYSDSVNIKILTDDIKQEIPLERIMQGQSFDEDSSVTGVELTYHKYCVGNDSSEQVLYAASESGTGDNIFVKFPQPMTRVYINAYGEILESNANYAIINISGSASRLLGTPLTDVTAVKRTSNPLRLASELENVSQITDATLVSESNVDSILEKCYNYLTRTQKTNLSIVEKDSSVVYTYSKYGEAVYGSSKYGSEKTTVKEDGATVHVGDCIKYATEFLGEKTGRVIEQSFNLNGNIIIKKAVVR